MAAMLGIRTLKYIGALGGGYALTIVRPNVENAIRVDTPQEVVLFQPQSDHQLSQTKDSGDEQTKDDNQPIANDLILIDPIRNAVDLIVSNPEILSSFAAVSLSQPQIPIEKVDAICETVAQCLQDDAIMSAIRNKIRSSPAQATRAPAPSTPLLCTLNDQWAQLIGSHKCCLCLDLLAAPCILNCGHSFCGECITSHSSRVSVEDHDGLVVSPTCPMCRTVITTQPTFERVLDEDIEQKVKAFPDCSEKRDWCFRRETFKLKLMLEEKQKKSKKSQAALDLDIDTETWAMTIAVVVIIVLVGLKMKSL
jgi:hypothetical protein